MNLVQLMCPAPALALCTRRTKKEEGPRYQVTCRQSGGVLTTYAKDLGSNRTLRTSE